MQIADGTAYAVLLRKGNRPVSAAFVDVYGDDAATIDFVTTQLAARLSGHGRALMAAVEGFLGQQVGTKNLLAVFESKVC